MAERCLSGPSCSKHRYLNELVKRSTCKVFCNFITKYTNILVETMREAAKASHIFFNKNIGIFEILTFEILTSHKLTTSLVLNNWAQTANGFAKLAQFLSV